MPLGIYIEPCSHFYFQEMVKGSLIFTFDSTKKARFGILPRYEKDEHLIRWFELPNCFIFHNGESLVFRNLYEFSLEVRFVALELFDTTFKQSILAHDVQGNNSGWRNN